MKEILNVNGASTKPQMKSKEIVPLNEDVAIDSWTINTVDGETLEKLFPGSTVFKNELGGTVVVFSGTPVCEFNLVEAFAFLTYSRKLQLIDILKKSGNLPVYFPSDEEVYLKAAKTKDQRLLVALFNIGLDPIENVELVFENEVSQITCLTPDGKEKEVSFTKNGDTYTLDIDAPILTPVILFAN